MNLDSLTSDNTSHITAEQLTSGVIDSGHTLTIGASSADIYTWAPNTFSMPQYPVWTKTNYSIFQALALTMGAQAMLELYRLLVTTEELSDELKEVRHVIEENLEALVARAY